MSINTLFLFLFHYNSLGRDSAMPGGLHARLGHTFLVYIILNLQWHMLLWFNKMCYVVVMYRVDPRKGRTSAFGRFVIIVVDDYSLSYEMQCTRSGIY